MEMRLTFTCVGEIMVEAMQPKTLGDELVERCKSASVLLLNGSRHEALRQANTALATRPTNSRWLFFNPSYAVFAYTRTELRKIITAAHVTILNRSEFGYVRSLLGAKEIAKLSLARGRVIVVTKGPDGAEILAGEKWKPARSRISRIGVFLGAGDAFVAGFAYQFVRGNEPDEALHYGLATAAAVVRSRSIRARLTEAAVRRWM